MSFSRQRQDQDESKGLLDIGGLECTLSLALSHKREREFFPPLMGGNRREGEGIDLCSGFALASGDKDGKPRFP